MEKNNAPVKKQEMELKKQVLREITPEKPKNVLYQEPETFSGVKRRVNGITV